MNIEELTILTVEIIKTMPTRHLNVYLLAITDPNLIDFLLQDKLIRQKIVFPEIIKKHAEQFNPKILDILYKWEPDLVMEGLVKTNNQDIIVYIVPYSIHQMSKIFDFAVEHRAIHILNWLYLKYKYTHAEQLIKHDLAQALAKLHQNDLPPDILPLAIESGAIHTLEWLKESGHDFKEMGFFARNANKSTKKWIKKNYPELLPTRITRIARLFARKSRNTTT